MRKLMIAVVASLVVGCGGYGGDDDYQPPAPGPNPPTTSAPTFTFGASGVSPKEVTVAIETTVTFVNNTNRTIELTSDPHPTHTDCPELNVGALAAGATRTVRITSRRASCGFHDHQDPNNTAVRGAVRITGY